MERVDVVELEPIIVDVARQCRDVNQDVLNNPKVHVRIGDARECYAETGDARLAAASRDLNDYLSMEGLPLDRGVTIRSAALR